MANVVTKLDGDVRWGAILGVLQTDGDKFRMGLSRKLKKSLKKRSTVCIGCNTIRTPKP